MENSNEELRIVLLGKTGAGKSSVGNTLLSIEAFDTKCSSASHTQICGRAEGVACGRKVVVIDTPGIFDTSRPEEVLEEELVSCLTECAPGPHAFVLVLEVGRYTPECRETVRKIWGCFGEEARKHTVVLFTHGDQLGEGMEIKHFLEDDQRTNNLQTNQKMDDLKTIKSVVEACGNRVHVIDNKHWKNSISQEVERLMATCGLSEAQIQSLANTLQKSKSVEPTYRSNDFQVSQLIGTICKMAEENGGHYTNPVLEKMAEAIEVEVKKIEAELKDEGQKQDVVEIRRRARERVKNRAWRMLSGVGTGVLIGAFFSLAFGSTLPVVLVTGLLTGMVNQVVQELKGGGDKPLLSQGKNFCAGIPVAAATTRSLLKNCKDIMTAARITGETAGRATGGAVGGAVGRAVGGAVVVDSATTGATVGAVAGIGVAVVAGVVATAGGIKGGMIGAEAAEKSDNPDKAAKMALDSVTSRAVKIVTDTWEFGQKVFQRGGENN